LIAMMTPAARIVVVLLLSAIVGGCQSAPPQPLMQPLASEGGEFGYRDRDLDAERVEVTYVGPRFRDTYGDDTSTEATAARDQAYDLALWRAAQIAKERGHPSFAVIQERRDVDSNTTVERSYGFPYPYGYRRPWGPWPYYGYDDYSVRSWSRATVTLVVDLTPAAGADTFDTAVTEERLRHRYLGEKWPPA
jgi:hypothetical protein